LKALLWKGGFLIFCLSFLPSCAALWPARTPREILSSPDLLHRIRERNEKIQSIRARAKVTINIGTNRFSVEELIIVRKPASLRVEAFSLIGRPILYLTTDGDVFEALVPGENRFYRGKAALKHVSAFLPFSAEIREMIPLMMGEMSLMDDERLDARYSEGDRLYVLEEESSGGSRRMFWIDPFHYALVRAVELDRMRNSRWEILFANFRKKGGIPFPRDIEFRSLISDRRMKIHLQEWQINPSLEDVAFRLDVPKGVEIIEMR
jgi:outer membrane lipoprotein-sorting protein